MAIVRVREHVNPLARKYQTAIAPPNWEKVFANPLLPLHLDIGCGRGHFPFQMAELEPSWNFLGLEIREPLVDQALEWRDEAGLQNLYYLFCNANNSLRPILSSLPSKSLSRVSIQFPDPWFKRKHQKRRVVQSEVVEILSEFLIPGGIVFLQSDVLAVEKEMIDRFAANPDFERTTQDWLLENPLPVQTERELLVLSYGDPVYRAVFRRI